MPRCVGNNEGAFFGAKIAIGNVNRNPLLTLCRKAIYKKGKIAVFTCCAEFFAGIIKCIKVVFIDLTRVK